MIERRAFGITRIAGLLLIAGVMLGGLPLFVAFAAPPRTPEPPPALKNPGVTLGGGKFDKSVFLADVAFGSATHIILNPTAEAKLGIAGTAGAVFVSAAGEVKSRVKFSSRVSFIEFVDVEKNGVWEFLNRGGQGWSDASLLDQDGRGLWTYGGLPGVNDMADHDKELVYQEVIADTCHSLAALPRDNSDVEDLLVGGTGKVWKYLAAK